MLPFYCNKIVTLSINNMPQKAYRIEYRFQLRDPKSLLKLFLHMGPSAHVIMEPVSHVKRP